MLNLLLNVIKKQTQQKLALLVYSNYDRLRIN